MTQSKSLPSPHIFQPGAARQRVAENLRIARLLRQWSQEDLAEAADLDRSYISGVEHAERNVSLDNLERLAHAVGMTIADLTSEADPKLIADKILDVIRSSVQGAPLRIKEEKGSYLAG